MSSEKRVKLSRVLCLGYLLVFFLTQYMVFGYERFPDTIHLENFSHDVYPLYSLALYLFRTVFGVDTGYYLLGMLQNVLLALCIFALTDYLRRAFALSGFVFWGASAAVALMFLVQRWATVTGAISSNTLFSEAFAIPFYLMFFRYALEAFLERGWKPFLLSCFWAAMLTLTRGQFYWVLAIVCLNGMRLEGFTGRKAFFCSVLACAAVFATVQGARYLQTQLYRDDQTKNPANLIVLTTAVYCSEKDDYLLFDEGSGERALLEEVRPWMDKTQNPVAFSYETGGLIERHKLFETEYDGLKDVIKAAYNQITADGTELSLGNVTKELILANFASFALHCLQNGWVGLIRTAALLRPGLDVYALILYLTMLLLSVTQRGPVFKPVSRFLCLGLLCSLLNAAVIAPGVFAQSRYVFYNMPILYLGLGVYLVKAGSLLANKLLTQEK